MDLGKLTVLVPSRPEMMDRLELWQHYLVGLSSTPPLHPREFIENSHSLSVEWSDQGSPDDGYSGRDCGWDLASREHRFSPRRAEAALSPAYRVRARRPRRTRQGTPYELGGEAV